MTEACFTTKDGMLAAEFETKGGRTLYCFELPAVFGFGETVELPFEPNDECELADAIYMAANGEE